MNWNILGIVMQVMQVVEIIKGVKGGKAKLEASVDAAGPLIAALEGSLGKDFLRQENIRPLYDAMVSANIAFLKAVEVAKSLPVKPAPKP